MRWIECVRYALHSLWLCVFPVMSVLAGTALLVFVPQATEVLLTFAETAGESLLMQAWRLTWLLLTAAAWGVGNWYAARLLLQRRFPAEWPPQEITFVQRWREWMPRVLGAMGPVAAGVFLLVAGEGRREWMLGAAMASAGAAVFLFVWARRPVTNWLMPGQRKLSAAAVTSAGLPLASRVVLWVVLSAMLALAAAVSAGGYGVTRFLKAPTLLFLALAFIAVTGSMLFVYLPKAFGGPSLALGPVVIWLVFAQFQWNHNHAISDRAAARAPERPDTRPEAAAHFREWLRVPGRDGRIILVAAEGGASRSAWWVGHVLGTADHVSEGEFSHRVFAASGVSGGSLGVASYVSLLARRDAATPRTYTATAGHPANSSCVGLRPEAPLAVQSACFTGRDFLSPVIGYMLFPDFIQRFVPWRMESSDRSLGLELSWQRDWRGMFGARDSFAQPLASLYESAGAWRTDLPVLLLNAAQATSGRLAIQSSVRLSRQADAPDRKGLAYKSRATDLLSEWAPSRNLPLATLVHNSARFPVVSPGGQIHASDGYFDTLVDGGYFENSGAHGLLTLLRAMEGSFTPEEWRTLRHRIFVVYITNDPPPRSEAKDADGCQDRTARRAAIRQEELLTPVIGLYNSRSARGASARFELERYLKEDVIDAAHVAGIEVPLDGAEIAKEPPSMTWYMTTQSRERMWRSLDRNACAGRALARAFTQVNRARSDTWKDRLDLGQTTASRSSAP